MQTVSSGVTQSLNPLQPPLVPGQPFMSVVPPSGRPGSVASAGDTMPTTPVCEKVAIGAAATLFSASVAALANGGGAAMMGTPVVAMAPAAAGGAMVGAVLAVVRAITNAYCRPREEVSAKAVFCIAAGLIGACAASTAGATGAAVACGLPVGEAATATAQTAAGSAILIGGPVCIAQCVTRYAGSAVPQ
jgi:hypothetical protein